MKRVMENFKDFLLLKMSFYDASNFLLSELWALNLGYCLLGLLMGLFWKINYYILYIFYSAVREMYFIQASFKLYA